MRRREASGAHAEALAAVLRLEKKTDEAEATLRRVLVRQVRSENGRPWQQRDLLAGGAT